MASLESKLFCVLLRLINKKKFLELQFAFGKFDFHNSRVPPKRTGKICNINRRIVDGRNVFVLTSKNGNSGKHILYLHGGAYVQNFVRQHWRFLSRLVAATHCTIIAPDYPLAPKHTFVDAFEMIVPLYNHIIDKAGSENTVVMGDSAGGGFALALCQRLKMLNMTQPGRIILLSPWLDLTLSNPDIARIDRVDPFLGITGLRKAALAYAGGYDLEHYMLSPINGRLEGLGAVSIFMGSRDILVADARALCVLAKERGIAIDYREYKDMVHVWMLLDFPESKHAQQQIKRLLEV